MEHIRKTNEVEMNEKMMKRVEDIDNLTCTYLKGLLELDETEAEEKFPWNIEILREIFEETVTILCRHGYEVCNPYIFMPESGRQYRCTLSECRCESCGCQDEFMEKERILSKIEEAVALGGLKVMDGDHESIIVRESRSDMDFEIHVKYLPE